jgi:hypothetical protein
MNGKRWRMIVNNSRDSEEQYSRCTRQFFEAEQEQLLTGARMDILDGLVRIVNNSGLF